MRPIVSSIVTGWVAASALASAGSPAHAESPIGSYVTIPVVISAGNGRPMEGERGLFFVPENRSRPGSTPISVRFLRFRALDASRTRPPVFILPGGPGYDFDFKQPWAFDLVQRLRRTRDVVYVSQRGYSGSQPANTTVMTADLRAIYFPMPLERPYTQEMQSDRVRSGYATALADWSARGVDFAGYDMSNLVDDVRELRAALGYDKLVLYGCSFGSQWAFSYMRRWPQTVDRALLTGVFMGGDYVYDAPTEIWSAFVRLAEMAQDDAHLAAYLPEGGLIRALQTVIERLERAPETVRINHPVTNQPLEVVVGADDLRHYLRSHGAFMGNTDRENLANWPQHILELYRGDYRYLAAKSWELRTDPLQEDQPVLWGFSLSLGHTAQRDAELRRDPMRRWLGDLNLMAYGVREIAPVKIMGGDWRTGWPLDIPVLLVNGDIDWYTTIESARHARKFLRRGHLLTVEGGTHCPAESLDELVALLPEHSKDVYGFVEIDFAKTGPEDYLRRLPETVTLPPIRFSLPSGPSLYEQWSARH